jgi:hypothetical protein
LRAEQVTAVPPEQWLAVVTLAQQHGVKALLYRQLKTLGLTDQVPPGILHTLRIDYLNEANRNMQIYRELGNILSVLHRENIPVIPLKGAYLAEHVYGNIAVRPMRDVDLLVKQEDLWGVEEILTEMRYIRLYAGKGEEGSRHVEYKHGQLSLKVEIHWDFVPEGSGLRVDLQNLWNRTKPTTVAGVGVAAMSLEDLLLHLCIHASDHVFEMGLRLVCDITETLRHNQKEIDWVCIQQRAQMWRANNCVYVNLWLAKNLLGAPIPENWLDSLNSQESDQRYLILAENRLFASVEKTDQALQASRNNMQVLYAKSVRDKLAFIFRGIFLSRQVMALKYHVHPNSLRIFLYYPVGLKDLLQKYGRLGMHLIRHDAQVRSRAEGQNEANALRNWLFSR